MAYIDEMRESGHWLFRWRSYLPLVFIVVILAALVQARLIGETHLPDEAWVVVCLAVSLFGLSIRCLAVGYTPARTSGRNAREQRADQLNTTGFYSIVRHPLYLGNFFIWMGIALFARDGMVVLACMSIFWLYYERIMIAEEAYIAGKFGVQFDLWANATPAFLPNPRLYRKSENAFSLRNVLKREYPAFSGIIFSLFLLKAFSDFQNLGKVEFDLFWKTLLALGIGVHLILRLLKKHTRLLHVPGR